MSERNRALLEGADALLKLVDAPDEQTRQAISHIRGQLMALSGHIESLRGPDDSALN